MDILVFGKHFKQRLLTYDGMTRVLVDDKVIGASTIAVHVVAVREVIVNYALLIDLAGLAQCNGLCLQK